MILALDFRVGSLTATFSWKQQQTSLLSWVSQNGFFRKHKDLLDSSRKNKTKRALSSHVFGDQTEDITSRSMIVQVWDFANKLFLVNNKSHVRMDDEIDEMILQWWWWTLLLPWNQHGSCHISWKHYINSWHEICNVFAMFSLFVITLCFRCHFEHSLFNVHFWGFFRVLLLRVLVSCSFTSIMIILSCEWSSSSWVTWSAVGVIEETFYWNPNGISNSWVAVAEKMSEK